MMVSAGNKHNLLILPIAIHFFNACRRRDRRRGRGRGRGRRYHYRCRLCCAHDEFSLSSRS